MSLDGARFIEAMSTVRLMEDKGEMARVVTGTAKLDSFPVSCCKSCLFDREISCDSEDINMVLALKGSWLGDIGKDLKQIETAVSLLYIVALTMKILLKIPKKKYF